MSVTRLSQGTTKVDSSPDLAPSRVDPGATGATYTSGIRDCDVCHKRTATHGADLLPNFVGDSAPLLICDWCLLPDGYDRPIRFR